MGIGIDTAGIDPGHAADAPVHHITLPAGLWHLEGLVNLGELPARGAASRAGERHRDWAEGHCCSWER